MRRLLLVLGVLVLAAPAPARADVRTQIFRECEAGEITGSYTPAQLRDARQNLPSDLAEYYDCVDVLRRAELAAARTDTPESPDGDAGGGGAAGGGATGGAAAPAATPRPELVPETDGDREALAGAARAGEQPVTFGSGELLAGITPGGATSDLPAPVLLALIGLGLAGAALSLPSLRRRAAALKQNR